MPAKVPNVAIGQLWPAGPAKLNEDNPMSNVQLVQDAYATFADVLRGLDDDASWSPTGCLGWSVRDLTHHCVSDAQRALVALHSPTGEPVNRDAVTYWQDWGPDPDGAANGRRYTRVCSSMFLHWSSCASCTSTPPGPSYTQQPPRTRQRLCAPRATC